METGSDDHGFHVDDVGLTDEADAERAAEEIVEMWTEPHTWFWFRFLALACMAATVLIATAVFTWALVWSLIDRLAGRASGDIAIYVINVLCLGPLGVILGGMFLKLLKRRWPRQAARR